MIRLLILIIVVAALALGFSWVADHPGGLSLAFGDLRIDTSLPVALAAAIALFVALWIVLAILRLAVAAPSSLSASGRARGREKGRRALATGMIAAAAGDLRAAQRASAEASKRLSDEPLTLLLEAQNAQLSGDRETAGRAFQRMAERSDMRLLGLRGLHAEALRNGDLEAAHEVAARAHAIAPLPWAAQAVLEHHISREDWAAALAAVEANALHKATDPATAARQRAVLLTASAMSLGERDPDRVLRLSQEALKLSPELTPAAVLAAGVLTRKQDIRRASRVIEASWRIQPHPDLARAYLALRPGDSASDRLARAQTLARIDRDHPESRMTVARAALEARDFLRARRSMAPLIQEGPPTRRMCLLMADIEEAEHGATGALREWLSRAARAPRDPAWVADGIVSDVWSPASPTGRLDAFVWKTPEELLTAPLGPIPPVLPPAEAEDADHEAVEKPANISSQKAPQAEAQHPPEIKQAPRPEIKQAPRAAQPVLFAHPQAPDDPGASGLEADESEAENRPVA